MQVFGSFIHSDKDTGSISLKVRKGDPLFYRSGPTRGRQFLHIPGSDFSPFILPAATKWVRLRLTNNKLPGNLLFVFVAGSHSFDSVLKKFGFLRFRF
jgi:hypothetical protein